MVQREVCKAEEDSRHVKAVAMNKQGSWSMDEGWENVRESALTWQDIWSMEGNRIQFLRCSMCLPTPSNLHTWGWADSPNCTLCGR